MMMMVLVVVVVVIVVVGDGLMELKYQCRIKFVKCLDQLVARTLSCVFFPYSFFSPYFFKKQKNV